MWDGYLVHLLWIVRFALVMVKSLSKCIKEDLSSLSLLKYSSTWLTVLSYKKVHVGNANIKE